MKKILKYSSLLFVVLVIASCDKFLDVNEDPNNPVSVTPDLVLPTAQVYTANVMQTDRRINCLGNMLMYNWSQSDGYAWYPDEFKYNVTSSFYQNNFNYTYSNTLKMYQVLANLDSTEYANYKAIGKIMKAYHFQLLVDMYGDVPYSEALQRSGEATPKYDDAKTIYENLIVELTNAIALINTGSNVITPGDDDTMFGGDMAKWKKFANTIKLRILVRQSSMSGRDTYLKEKFAEIAAEGSGYITADVGVNPGYTNITNQQSPLWDSYGKDPSGTETMSGKATCATDYILAYLKDTKDPRIDKIYEKPASGHLGVPQGLLDYDTPVVDAFMPDKVSNIGPGILKGANMKAMVYTLAECYFNLAEARLKNLITTGDAKTYYQNGITASFTTLGLTSADATTYYSQTLNNVNYDASVTKLQAIITQKWIAVNGMTAEQSWFDYNRTGYPAGLPRSMQATSNRPVRLAYPAGEYSSNGENVPTQPNVFTEKVFWGK